MRVAIVHNRHSKASPSGEDVVVDAEAAALRRAGVDVEVYALDNDEEATRPLHGVRAAATVVTRRGRAPALDGSFDVVHVHNLFPHYGTDWLARVRSPVVSTQHSYRPMCANGYLFRAGAVCTRCLDGDRWAGVRYRCYRNSALATLPLSLAGRKGPAADPLIRRSDRVIVLSQRSRELFIRGGVAETKLVLDWHFLPDDLVGAASRQAGAHWLFVGRLSAEKGIERLIDAWPHDVALRVVGDGEDREAVEAAARGKRVELLGALPRDGVLEEMRDALGLVMPSLWFETFGLVYIEALSAGLPVVALGPNVIADAVRRDGTGLVTEWNDLESTLLEAGRVFPGLRSRCREVFEQDSTEAAFVRRRLDLYAELAR